MPPRQTAFYCHHKSSQGGWRPPFLFRFELVLVSSVTPFLPLIYIAPGKVFSSECLLEWNVGRQGCHAINKLASLSLSFSLSTATFFSLFHLTHFLWHSPYNALSFFQCDQIWRNFATLAKLLYSLTIVWECIRIWQKIDPILAKFS